MSLAIGKEGQNVRLAAKLTGWKIDIKSKEQFEAYLEDRGITEEELAEEFESAKKEVSEDLEAEDDITLENSDEVSSEEVSQDNDLDIDAKDDLEVESSRDNSEESEEEKED